MLPSTSPGLSRDEGVFLTTAADNGSRATYFIAGNTRHSILASDLQFELARNPLWPTRNATRDEVLAYPEGAPVGSARGGLVTAPVTADEPVAEIAAWQPAAVVSAPQPVGDTPQAEPALATEPEPVAAAPDATQYTLRPGDNLTRLSEQHGTTIQAILAANGLTNANRIYIGQTLIIPAGAPPAPAPVADVPQPTALTYTVKAGDSAITIARQFNVDLDALLAANGVVNRNRIYVGQTLAIPS